MNPTNLPVSFVGIDVSKQKLDVARRPDTQHREFTYDAEGLTALIQTLKSWGPIFVVVEATGGLERLVVTELVAADIELAVVNPRQVRDFAKGVGKLAKTDPIDADMLAWFAEVVRPATSQKVPQKQVELQELVTRRQQLIALRVAETNRQGTASVKLARRSLEKMLKTIHCANRRSRRGHRPDGSLRRRLASQGRVAPKRARRRRGQQLPPARLLAGVGQAQPRTDCRLGWPGSLQP